MKRTTPESARSAGPRARRTHLVVFTDPEHTVAAVRQLVAAGFSIPEVYTPFPVHGLDVALGQRDTRIGWVTLAGGVLGLALALGFQAWTHVVDWPLNIGGKTNLALPALIPITFELAVLGAALGTVAAFLLSNRLCCRRPLPRIEDTGIRVADDQFAVLVEEDSAAFDPLAFAHICEALAPVRVIEAWRVQ